MIDISGRDMRAGIRGFTAVAAASCFVVMPQFTNIASAHTGGKATRAHEHASARRDHDGRGTHDARDHDHDHDHGRGRGRGRGRADVVVDTRGPRRGIVPGRTYKWPFEVTNRGSVPAKDVSLTATPDRNLKVLSVSPKCRWRHAGPLVCDIGLLPQGRTRRGVITATVRPRTRAGKALSNPVQVSWQNAPGSEQRRAAFPTVEVAPDAAGMAGVDGLSGADGRIPYPLTVTEHGPVTAESVVVRSPIGIPAQQGPCANGIVPGMVAGKSAPIKPALGPCGAKQDDPAAACACAPAHEPPVAERPAVTVGAPASAESGRPATAPCGAVAARHVTGTGRPVVPPCAQQRPAAPDRPASEPATAPCGVLPARPDAVPARPVVPPCAQSVPAADGRPAVGRPAVAPCGAVPARPVTGSDRPIILPCVPRRPVNVPPSAANTPVMAPCGAAASRPVILPAPVHVPPAAPPCAGVQGRTGTVKEVPAAGRPADKPVSSATDKPVSSATDKPVSSATDKPARKPADTPAGDARDKAASVPAATPCGASATSPVVVPGRPVVVPEVPAIPPCAQGRPGACGCLSSQHLPAAPAAEPAIPAVPQVPAAPAVPDRTGVAPCSGVGEDKPMATGKSAPEHPLRPTCAQHVPSAVHEVPGATPDTVEPMTPLAGPGKAAHRPLGRPHHRPPALGRAHRDCTRQGTGFICPLGSAPRHRPHVFNLGAPGHPHELHCVGAAGGLPHPRGPADRRTAAAGPREPADDRRIVRAARAVGPRPRRCRRRALPARP